MANKKISPIETIMGNKSTSNRTATDYYLDIYQENMNESWDYYANVYNIEMEEPYGSQRYIPVQARISNIPTGKGKINFGDDYKSISMKDAQFSNGVGHLYRFDSNYWLTMNPEMIKQIATSAMLRRCNVMLKWRDSETGNIYTEPMIAENKMSGDNSEKIMLTLPVAIETCYVQRNSRTIKIKPNQRFMLGNTNFWNVFRVSGGGITNFLNQETDDVVGPSIIAFSVIADYVNSATDDIVNGIADSVVFDYTPSIPVLPSQTVIQLLPSSNEVKQGETVIYSPKLYVNGVLTSTTFTFTSSGVPSKYYEFSQIDGLSFSIKNNYMYMKEPISVQCSCNEKVQIFNIWLVGW